MLKILRRGFFDEAGETDVSDDPSQETEDGSYSDVGSYSNPDGTVGTSGTMSGSDEPYFGEGDDYEASVGATMSVGLLLGGVVVDGVFAGVVVATILGSPITVGEAYMFGEVAAEMTLGIHDAIFGD